MKTISEKPVHLHSGVKDAAMRLAEATRAEAVVLFGSRARGDHTQDSDWDLCVVLPDEIPSGKYTPITLAPISEVQGESVQVYPLRKSVFENKRHDVNSVSYDIAEDGVVIFGRL